MSAEPVPSRRSPPVDLRSAPTKTRQEKPDRDSILQIIADCQFEV